MNIRIGDKVKFIDEVGGGNIVGIKNNLVTVEDEHGFQYEVAENSVILDQKVDYTIDNLSEDDFSSITSRDIRENEVDLVIQAHVRTGKISFLEVDLHIQHLMTDAQKLSSHDMVMMQMRYVKKMFESAKKHKYTKVVFIHGVGAGRLKEEIRSFLSKKSNCEFHDASIQAYGYGATEVRLWYN